MWCVLKEVGLLFSNSPKRQSALEVQIDTLPFAISNRRKLVDLCRTRWMARQSALVAFADLYVPVVAALEEVSQGRHWSPDSAGAASTLLSSITQFSFICAFCISKHVLEYFHGLTTALQKTSKDICNAYQEVKTVTETLHRVREDIDIYHGQWPRLAESMAEKVGVNASLPRICCRQTNRQNTPAATPKECFKRKIAIPLGDDMCNQMRDRFLNMQQLAFKGLYLIPSTFLEDPARSRDAVSKFAEEYREDPPDPSLLGLPAELDLWEVHWKSRAATEVLPHTTSATLVCTMGNIFPNMQCLLALVCTIPFSAVECEWSVSCLRRLKTYLRSTMGANRLTALALLHTL